MNIATEFIFMNSALDLIFFHKCGMCTIKIFRGGEGWWMGRGVAVKDA